MNTLKRRFKRTKEVFSKRSINRTMFKHFSCAESTLILFDKASGIEQEDAEQAIDPLNGGVVLELDGGCGIFWGSVMAAGIRAAKRFEKEDDACSAALHASIELMREYISSGASTDCNRILDMDRWNSFSYLSKGKMNVCIDIAEKWAPQFDDIIDKSFDGYKLKQGGKCVNCSVDVFKSVASEIGLNSSSETPWVAGFAGGIGLQGSTCAAISSAVFALNLLYFRSRNKSPHSALRSMMQGMGIGVGWMKPSKRLVSVFKDKFHSKYCRELTGKTFKDLYDFIDHIESGKCRNIISGVSQIARDLIST
jgi:hypothetical protein